MSPQLIKIPSRKSHKNRGIPHLGNKTGPGTERECHVVRVLLDKALLSPPPKTLTRQVNSTQPTAQGNRIRQKAKATGSQSRETNHEDEDSAGLSAIRPKARLLTAAEVRRHTRPSGQKRPGLLSSSAAGPCVPPRTRPASLPRASNREIKSQGTRRSPGKCVGRWLERASLHAHADRSASCTEPGSASGRDSRWPSHSPRVSNSHRPVPGTSRPALTPGRALPARPTRLGGDRPVPSSRPGNKQSASDEHVSRGC